MAINPKAKGNRGETIIRDKLRELTGLKFERVPASGALPFLKGDLFVPNENCTFCIECKNYEDSFINDTLLTNKSNKIIEWWTKLELDAAVSGQKKLLIVKYNRSKIFIVTDIKPSNTNNYLHFKREDIYILLLEEWVKTESIKFIK